MKYLLPLLLAGCGGSHIEPLIEAAPIEEGFYSLSLKRTVSDCGMLPENKDDVLEFIRHEDGTLRVVTEGVELISTDDSYFIHTSGVPGLSVSIVFALQGTSEGLTGEGELSIESPTSGCKDFASITGRKISGKKNKRN